MASPIVDYVLSLNPGVDDIANVNPFAKYTGVVIPKEVTVTKTLKGSGVLTLDSDALVSVRTIMIRYTKNLSPDDKTVYVKRIFSHPAAQEEDEESDRIMKAMGGIPGCVLAITPKDDSSKSVFVMKESPHCLYLQAPFVKTCMLLDETTNLMNGIIQLPPQICGELPKQAVIFDDRGESVSFEVDYYVLVPYNHVLAWCLCVSDHWRRKRGIFAIEMDVTPRNGESFILYFAVANQSFERIKQACITNFIRGKIDKRPLNTVGLEVVGGAAEISTTFTYLEYPRGGWDSTQVIPTLDPHFVPYSQVLQAEVEEIRAKEEEVKRWKMQEGEEMDTGE